MDAFVLKTAALGFMVLDHVHTYLNLGPNWIGLLTRFVAPLFVFFLVEGFFHTRNRGRYAKRMLLMALVMFLGNVAVNLAFHNVDYMTGTVTVYSATMGNNIFLTLGVFLLILGAIERAKGQTGWKKAGAWACAAVLMVCTAVCEGGPYLLPVLLVCYGFYGNRKKVCLGIGLWCGLLLASAVMKYASGSTGLSLWNTLCYDSQWAMALVILPILLYNGQRGRNDTFAKWLFYLAYPAHLWVLRAMAVVLG